MNIALFYNLPSGGAKRTVFEQAKRLNQVHNVDVYTLASANQKFCDIGTVANVNVVPFTPFPLFSKPLRRLNQINRCIDIIRLHEIEKLIAKRIDYAGYDVVLVHPCQFTTSPAILQFLKTPTVYYSHDVCRRIYDPVIPRPYSNRNSWQRVLDRIDLLPKIYSRMADFEDRSGRYKCNVYLTNSYFTRESIYRIYGRAPNVSYHGVDVNFFQPLGLERKNQVISVGSILPNKGFDFIIQSLATINEKFRPPLLIISNSFQSKEKDYLVNLANSYNVSLQFQHLINDEELRYQYNRATLTVYAPVMESFGLVPLESMACGTPVVGVAEGGVRETIKHGSTGLLTRRDPHEFGEAICTLTNNPSIYRKYGQQGRETVVKHWNWEKAILTLTNYLSSAAIK
jgi:glycosyltransferase involved in cell wall biosynthesis